MISYCIVIPTYRRTELIRRNWQQIATHHDCVVVCREDEEQELLNSGVWDIVTIPNDSANGVGLPRSKGTSWAVGHGYDVIFQSDDDTVVKTPELIPEMANLAYILDNVLGAKQPFDFGAADKIPEFLGQTGNLIGFWGFRADLVERIGNFDPDFFISEDHEFIWRARHEVKVESWTKFKVQHRVGQPGGLAEEHYVGRTAKQEVLWNKKYPGLVKVTGGGKRIAFNKKYVHAST